MEEKKLTSEEINEALGITPEKQRMLDLIDDAARGNIEAAALLGDGYFCGTFEETPNYEKALKWSRYAAKRGNELAKHTLEELKKLGYEG